MELFESLKNVWALPLEEDNFIWASMFWIVNSIFWLLDLYPLVKKKSIRETVAVMMLPGFIVTAVALSGSLMLGITTTAPLLNGFSYTRKRVCVESLILASVFLAVWFLAMRLRGSRNDTWKKRLFWALSYVPDLIIVGCILTVSLSRLIGGIYLLPKLWSLSAALGFTSYNIFAWLYAYGIMTLLIRLALLLVAILDRLISIRIPVGAYGENAHPVRRFVWYAAICQNAYLRGVLAFFVPATVFFAAALFRDKPDSLQDMAIVVGFLLFFVTETFVAVLITLKPVVANLRRFSKWGDRKAFMEQFCREYFNETPVLKTLDYTVTRHFLVDERSTVNIYYLEMLKGFSCCQRASVTDQGQKNNTYWSQPHTVDLEQRSGWQWEISFLDGDICAIEKEDASVEEIIRILSSYRDTHRLEEQSTLRSGIGQYNNRSDGFDKLFRFGLGTTGLLLMVLMLISSNYMMGANGTRQQTDTLSNVNNVGNVNNEFPRVNTQTVEARPDDPAEKESQTSEPMVTQNQTSMPTEPEEPKLAPNYLQVYIQPDTPEPFAEMLGQLEEVINLVVQDPDGGYGRSVWEKMGMPGVELKEMLINAYNAWWSVLPMLDDARYSLTDLTGDGFPELIMGRYSVYSDSTSPKAVCYYSETDGIGMIYLSDYYTMELYEGGVVEFISGGAAYTETYIQFQEETKSWQEAVCVIVDWDFSTQSARGYYWGENLSYFADPANEPMSEEEYQKIISEYVTDPMELEWTPLILGSQFTITETVEKNAENTGVIRISTSFTKLWLKEDEEGAAKINAALREIYEEAEAEMEGSNQEIIEEYLYQDGALAEDLDEWLLYPLEEWLAISNENYVASISMWMRTTCACVWTVIIL